MKIKYYTYGNIVTVCLIVEDENCARGISVTSFKDVFDKKTGEQIAMKNAFMALGRSKQLRPIFNKSAKNQIIRANCPFVKKGELNPVLTYSECKLLKVKEPGEFKTTVGEIKTYKVDINTSLPSFYWKPLSTPGA